MSDEQLYFYSESIDMYFPVSRLDWADWYEALRVAAPRLDDTALLAALIISASTETRSPDVYRIDMPWYERENYLAQAIITAGWAPPGRPSEDGPAGGELDSNAGSRTSSSPVDDRGWNDWYEAASLANPQLDDLHLLGELIHASAYEAHETGVPGPQHSRHLAQNVITAGWTPPTARRLGTEADQEQ